MSDGISVGGQAASRNDAPEWSVTVWRCSGYDGISVWVAEDDLRYLVSFGAHAAEQPAAKQSLPPFSKLGDTLEWRLDMPQQRPFATILKWTPKFGPGAKL